MIMNTNRIRRVLVAALALLLTAGTAAAETILQEDFTELFSDSYEIWGTADPFNRVEAYEGNLEFEGSFGLEAFGVYFNQEIDLTSGPITISFDLVRNSTNPGSEICVWLVKQYLIDGDPWTEGDFIRIGFFSSREEVGDNALLIQETSPESRGVGKQTASVPNVFTMGEKFSVEWVLSTDSYTVRVDGEEVLSGTHGTGLESGYLHIHDWNSLEGDVDMLSNLVVTQ